MDSYDFRANLTEFFSQDQESLDKIESVDWDSWLYKPGFPPKPAFDTSLVDPCYRLAGKWEALNNGSSDFTPQHQDVGAWVANQTVVFLETVQLFKKPLSHELVRQMGQTYKLASSQNVELVSRFFVIALKARDTSFLEPVAQLLSRVGRMKFVRPLFRHLKQVDASFARKVFDENKDFYHPICRGMVEKDLSAGASK